MGLTWNSGPIPRPLVLDHLLLAGLKITQPLIAGKTEGSLEYVILN